MSSFVSILKLAMIGLLGYVVIALGQTVVLELLLGGRLAPSSSPTTLAAATLGTIASGLTGGYLAARLGGGRPLLHASVVVILLALDTIFVVVNRLDGNPIWFDLGGSLTLILATVAGCWLRIRQRPHFGGDEPRPGPASIQSSD